jgi:hypothetical protein
MAEADIEMAVFYTLDSYRRPERQWKDRGGGPSHLRVTKDDSEDGRNGCCPNCCLPVERPFVSAYLPGRIEHYWLCKSCEWSWTS